MIWLPSAVGFIIGGVCVIVFGLLRRRWYQAQVSTAQETAERILEEAKKEAAIIRKETQIQARDNVLQAKIDFDKEVRERRRDLQQAEKRIAGREENIDKRTETVEKRDAELSSREQALREREKVTYKKDEEYAYLLEEAKKHLEQIADMTRDEAKRTLLEQMLDETRQQATKRVLQIEEEAREEAERRAKKIVTIAIERMAGEFVAERTVSVIHLPSDDMKGRIIGREGRNIRAIEAATGVDLIIDDTPEAVILSSHSPIRREIARVALEKLISDGRIHPARIEEVVRKAEQEIEESVREAGQRAILEMGIHGVHPELVKLLGMLKYRYSFAQNVLMHSLETAYICSMMAGELGLNEKQARRAGLLHDIGKAVSHEVEGSHAVTGGELARKYGESAKIVNAIAAHHEEVKAETILAPLVDAADALSGARPGARREMLENYVRRLEDLERISNSFSGVEKSFAIQAGRELRIIVEPRTVTDGDALMLAREVAKKIENDMTYPGQIKVTVIRETRAMEYAR